MGSNSFSMAFLLEAFFLRGAGEGRYFRGLGASTSALSRLREWAHPGCFGLHHGESNRASLPVSVLCMHPSCSTSGSAGVYVTHITSLNGDIDGRQALKFSLQSSVSPLPFTHLSSAVTTADTQPEAVLDPFPAHSARLCAGAHSQAGEVDFTVVPEAPPAAALCRADNKPLACILSFHVTLGYTS